jgi:hypothetical protein
MARGLGGVSILGQISRSEFRALLRQAQREQAATDAGFVTHADMVAAHRAARVEKMRARREARLTELRAG